MVVEADEFAPVPVMQRIGGVFGYDHRAVVGVVLVDGSQVERDLGGGRGADADGAPLPRDGDGAVKIAADQSADLLVPAHHVGETSDPGSLVSALCRERYTLSVSLSVSAVYLHNPNIS